MPMKTVVIGYASGCAPRVAYGIRSLKQALQVMGYDVREEEAHWAWDSYRAEPERKIVVGNRTEPGRCGDSKSATCSYTIRRRRKGRAFISLPARGS
ncbi:hypothetical protein LJK87_20835 [Paenibacillus sp. P25]|nr:hypothetical protein LJK87_20835 [Paenibacillus sp. P25]